MADQLTTNNLPPQLALAALASDRISAGDPRILFPFAISVTPSPVSASQPAAPQQEPTE